MLIRWRHVLLPVLLVYGYSFTSCSLILIPIFFLLVVYFVQLNLKQVAYIMTISLFFFCYFTLVKTNTDRHFDNTNEDFSRITVISDSITINGDLLSLKGKRQGETYQCFYQLRSKKEKEYFEHLHVSFFLDFSGDFELATQKRNFNGFDYRNYLKKQGIYRIIKLKTIKKIDKLSIINPYFFNDCRRSSIVWIRERFPKPMNHYMTGLIFGYLDKSFDEMSEIYGSLGIIHLFALSGLQVGFFLNWFKFFLLRIGLTREKMILFQLPISIVYAILTGLSLSVIRSLIQSYLSEKQFNKWDNFIATLIIILILFPYSIMTIGGSLTMLYAFIITYIDSSDNGVREQLKRNILISIFSLPILLFNFSSFQPISIFLTYIFSFLFDYFILPILVLSYIISPFFNMVFLNSIFIWLEFLIKWIYHIFPKDIVFGHPSLWLAIIVFAFIVFCYDFKLNRGLQSILVLLILLITLVIKNPLSNEVTIIDVGQGDSIFIKDMAGKTVLIDTGGKVDFTIKNGWKKRSETSNAEKTLVPYLKSRGVGKIDTLVLTHTDTDHVGDMLVLAKSIKIGQILVSQGSLTNQSFVKKLKMIKSPVKIAHQGDRLPIMGSYLEILYPLVVGDGSNNDSIVLHGNLLDINFLFTGDLESEGEKVLVEHYSKLKVDVLKAGHHGSKGSSSQIFLKHIQPKIIIISAGENNRYHHPHQEMLERVFSIGGKVFRTDRQGAIRFIGIKHFIIETVR